VVALMALAVVGAVHDGGGVAASFAYSFALVALPAVLGYATRTRRQYLAEVEARLAAAERDRDERARVAVVEERQRIARELHDVVAHHVSLIGVQAGAARTALTSSPERAAAALSAIEESSRAAVGEMRQLLDVLAPRDGLAPPQPDLAAVPVLVDRWRASGVRVDAQLTGDPSTVAPTVSACAYRIVEEALTNVARHSAAMEVTVRVRIDQVVHVEVSDPGPRRSVPSAPSAGRGLTGMRERVELCGGTLEAGPVPDGSFRVVATMRAVPA
jgi:signal transduction histidine kinase